MNKFAIVALSVAATLTHCASTGDSKLEHLQEAARAATFAAESDADAAAAAAAANAPPPKRILRLTVLDEKSRKPVAHAGVYLADRAGLGWTDIKGQSEWWNDDMAEAGEIQIRCPAVRAMAGKRIKRVPYHLTGYLTEIAATIDADSCVEPPEKSISGNFAGRFARGFEFSSFVPCQGLPADANFYAVPAVSAWVNFSKGSYKEFNAFLHALPPGPDRITSVQDGVYVEWIGTLTGPGSYGHLGGNLYQFDVSRVLKVSTDVPANCAAKPI